MIEEPDLVCGDDPAPWIHKPPGVYELRCTGYKFERVRMYGAAWKLRLTFRFMNTEKNEHVCGFYHLGREAKPKIGRKSRYFADWVIANGGTLPRRGASMSPRKFVGHVFKCTVRDVTNSVSGGKHPKEGVYSTVSGILEMCA